MRSVPANAQQATHLRTVGVLMGLANDAETQARAKVIEQGLAKKGWIVGQNLRIEYRFAAGDIERMLSLSKELVALHPDVIIGHSTPVVAALLKATQTIPIVFVVVGDPVGSGFVASFARPGGNVTGFSVLQATITGKYLSILRELIPQIARVAIMYNPESVSVGGASYMPAFMESAKEFNVTPIEIEVHSTDEIETGIADLGAAPGSALIVLPDNFNTVHRKPSSRWQLGGAFQPSMHIVILSMKAAYYPMALTCWIYSDERPITWIVSSTARIPQTFPCRHRGNSNL